MRHEAKGMRFSKEEGGMNFCKLYWRLSVYKWQLAAEQRKIKDFF
jgi:hypothetical protein